MGACGTDGRVVAWSQVFQGLEGASAAGQYSIRFTPDGFPGPLSPDRIRFVQSTETTETVVVVRRTRNRLGYEIETYEVPASER